MTTDISNSDDIIDSRQVSKRIEELQDERICLVDDVTEAQEEYENAKVTSERDGSDLLADGELGDNLKSAEDALKEWDDGDEAKELANLKALQEQGEGYSDWRHGVTLIRDDHFEKYAEQYAEDIGAIPDNAQWPCTCIDWEKAARELRMDYTAIEFDGVTYWVR